MLIWAFLLGWNVYAQNITEGSFPFIKKISAEAYGVSREYTTTEDEMHAQLAEMFREAADVKVKETKNNVYEAKSARLLAISPQSYDYYYRVEKIKGKANETVRLTLFVSVGNYNFVTPDRYPEVIKAARNWMLTVEEGLADKARVKALGEENKLLETQQKSMEDLTKENVKLAEELKAIQAKIQKNQEAQEAMKKKIEETQNRRKKLGGDSDSSKR